MSSDDLAALLGEQVAYYRARAPEYDKWFLRDGVYDLGEEFNAVWGAELDAVTAALDRFGPQGDVLDLAAGTGLWTRHLVRHASHVTALDAAPEALAINRRRLEHCLTPVEYVQADVFSWAPDRRFDVVFLGFFLTHVPPTRLDAFWNLVAACLKPEGRFFLVDNARPFEDVVPRFPGMSAAGGKARTPWSSTDLESGVSTRRLEDGREFQIVKVYWEPERLTHVLAELGWTTEFAQTHHFFLYGNGSPAE